MVVVVDFDERLSFGFVAAVFDAERLCVCWWKVMQKQNEWYS